MKKIYKIALILLLSQNLFAQRYNVPLNLPNYDNKPMHFGFLIGLNTLDFKLTPVSNVEDELFVIQSQNQKGFNLGVVSNMRLGNNLDFRFIPTLSLAERRIFYTLNDNTVLTNENKKIESTFIEFPISIKYKSLRYNNGRAYIMTGLKYSLDLASQRNIDDEGLEIVKIKKDDFLYEIGLGLDFYLPYFKFSPELKANFGLTNLVVNDGSIYSRSIKGMKTRGFSISFTFE
ncbi:MAG: PorT family protein [Flavobacteriales bacterium]|nr:PorT family protein [Flavobacteriales bacterium]